MMEVIGLDEAISKLSNVASKFTEVALSGIERMAQSIVLDVAREDPALGNYLEVVRQGESIYIYPTVPEKLWGEYLKLKTEKQKKRAEFVKQRCPWQLYQEVTLRRAVTKYLKPSKLREVLEMKINSNEAASILLSYIRGALGI